MATLVQKQQWTEQLTHLSADPEGPQKRGAIVDKAAAALEGQTKDIKEGLTFDMEVLADTRFTKFMQAVGLSATKMTSLAGDGDADKEVDTFADLPKLKSMSGADVVKAVEALKKVATVSDKAREDLLALRFEEAGYKPQDLKRLQEALEQRKKNATDKEKTGGDAASAKENKDEKEELDKFEKDSARIGQEVDEAVGDEVWTPLVRQGVMPENLVPDRYSNVKRTFTAASQAYTERLEEYSKGLDKNSDLLAKLGVANDVSKGCIDLATNIAKMTPLGEEALKHVETAGKLLSIVSATGFTVAGQAIKKEDAQNIVDSVLKGVADVCSTAIPDKTVGDIVSGSVTGAISAGRAVRAIVDRKPDAFLDSLSAAVNSALNAASTATKNQTIKDLTPMIVGTIKNSGQAAKFAATCKDGDKDAIKKALGELINSSMNTVADWVKYSVTQTEKGKAGEINKAIDVAVGSSKELVTAAVSQGKVTDFSSAIGNIANGALSAFLKPPELGKSVGALASSALGSAGPGLVKGIQAKDPAAVLKTFKELVGKSLATAASGVESDKVKAKIEEAAKLVDTWMSGLGAANDLGKAVKDGKYEDINKAAKSLFQETGNYISQSLKAAGLKGAEDSDDAASEEGGDDKSADFGGADASKEAKEAKAQEAAAVKKLKDEIAAQDKILGDENAAADKKVQAAKDRTKAVEALKEHKEMKNELALDSEQFAMMLNMGMEDDDPEDDGTPPPKIQDLILQIQKDKKTFDLVESLSGAGIKVAAQFFPAAGAAIDFQKFSFEVIRSVQHVRQLLDWLDNAADAKSAVTVQVHAMLSRVGMEKRQVLEHNMRAALALIAAIGQVVTTVGAHAAPVGVALTAGARAGESGLELIKKVADATEMEAGWQKFQAAMADPRNRKGVRAAIESNPTLAKYTLAWGALQGKDAIAKEAMRKCGLTDAVLRQEDTNVKEVQKYLEEMFSEDLVILRAVPLRKAWYPAGKKPELTLRSWTAFLSGAYNHEDEPLAAGSGGAVSQAMAVLDGKEQEFKKAKAEFDKAKAADEKAPDEAVKKAKQELVDATTGVQNAARGFNPLNGEGQEHKEMREYLDALVALGDIRLRELEGETVALTRAEAA
jgi:hypothetical protein